MKKKKQFFTYKIGPIISEISLVENNSLIIWHSLWDSISEFNCLILIVPVGKFKKKKIRQFLKRIFSYATKNKKEIRNLYQKEILA